MITLVAGGKSAYKVVIAKNATPAEQKAGNELCKYIEQITGIKLDICTDNAPPVSTELVVGNTNRGKIGGFTSKKWLGDAFIIQSKKEKLFFVGENDRGTLYAVYEFLEKYLNCRFYTETFEVIPKQSTILLPKIKDRQIPVFDYRGVHWFQYYPQNISVKRRVNYNHHGYKKIMDEENGGGISYAKDYFVHTFETFLKKSNITLEEHPEYFSLGKDGKRNTYQMCLTNPDVLKMVIRKVREVLIDEPDTKIISVSQNDGGNPCMCESCKKVYAEENDAYSGTLVRFVNAVAKDIKKDYPNVLIDTLAYQYTRKPCKTKLENNVIVRLCTIECCCSHPIANCDIATYLPEDYLNGNSFKHDLITWNKASKKLYIWDYTTNFKHYNMNFPNFDVILDNARFFAEHNVKGLYSQGANFSTHGEFEELRCYLLSKIMWNPYMSKKEYYALMDEFLNDYYGESAKYIREYLDYVENETNARHFSLYGRPDEIFPNTIQKTNVSAHPQDLNYQALKNYKSIDWDRYFDYYGKVIPHKAIEIGYEKFEKALALAKDEAEYKRIDKSKIQVEYLDSYYRLDVKEWKIKTVNKLLDTILSEVEAEDKDALKEEVMQYVRNKVTTEYFEYNKALYERLKQYNITKNQEHGKFLDKAPTLYFDHGPYHWDIPNGYYDGCAKDASF